jgi:hypothetical protein
MIVAVIVALIQPLLLYGSIAFFIGVALLLLSEGTLESKLLWILTSVLIWFIITMTIFFILSFRNDY